MNSCYLYSLNGNTGSGSGTGETGEAKGTGTVDDPFNVVAAINAVKDLSWTSNTEYEKVGPYYVKGIVKSVEEAYGTKFGNGTFYIKDADTDNEFYVYRALYLNNKKFAEGDTALAEGDEVIIYGELMNYRGNIPETVMNSCYLYSLNGNTGSGGGESGGEKATTIAGIVAQIPDTATGSSSAADYEAELTGAVVSYVNGNNAYLEDASGAILLYLANHGLAAGDVISGKVSGKGYYFNGLPEITAIGTEYTKTAGGTIPETEMTIAALMDNYAANMSRRIKIKGVTVTDAIADGDRNGAIKQGDASIAVYASLNNKGLVLAENATGDIIAFPTVYSKNGTTTYQLSFWDNSQFTATGGGTGGGDEPAGTAYVLDKDAITAAHTSAWSYTSGSKTVTATDGSEWTLYNTFADKNQVTVQMNKGKGAYVLTPALPAGMEVKTIAVVLNTKKDGTGNMGDRPMDILNADGSSTLLAEKTGQTLADGVAVASGNSQVRIICNEAKGGAVYITSITVTYGAAE